MSEMVERCANAIADTRARLRHENDKRLVDNGFWPDHHWQPDDAHLARTAIEAMREPTETMKKIGGSLIAGLGGGQAIKPYEDDAGEAWSAMITAALAPPS